MQPKKLQQAHRANHILSRGYAQGGHAMISKITSSNLEKDCQNCQTRNFMGTELMLCQVEITQCDWAIPYKKELFFCKHPTASQFNRLVIA